MATRSTCTHRWTRPPTAEHGRTPPASSIDGPADELIEQVDGDDLVLSADPPGDGSLDAGEIDASGVDSAQFSDGEATLVVDQLGAVEDCHVAGSVYATCPDDGVPLG